ncbi:hypothetical protein H7U22_15750 [Pedobacter sp. CCM 8938]|uniref:Uncharacterized protein n=2 Tax=Pedobacter fastidiosus TaxID=2765361 RepID=A0ABR7KW07_9SPHI|nr:hypothetical protein [Pedobacter fastidiosus]
MGDFSTLQDLPDMYRHCKSTEDKDMTPLDFITDHLMNIDGLFDEHNNGDEQKAHAPLQNQHVSQIVAFQIPAQFCLETANLFFEKKILFFDFKTENLSKYISKTFRPPIV